MVKSNLLETEQIEVCGFNQEEVIKKVGAKGWLSLTAASDGDNVPEGYDCVEQNSRILVNPVALDKTLADQLVKEIESLPRPLVISCASGARAGTVAWLYTAKKHNIAAKDVIQMGQENHLLWADKKPLIDWLSSNLS